MNNMCHLSPNISQEEFVIGNICGCFSSGLSFLFVGTKF